MKYKFDGHRRASGFTLMELMITVAIVGILSAIAYPSYMQYVVKTNRSAAESVLLSAANKQEQYILDARRYATSATELGIPASSLPKEVSENYDVNVSADNAATPPTFTITAQPKGVQATRDTRCANLRITAGGVKSITGTGTVAQCW